MIISSQRYLNEEVVTEKKEAICDESSIDIPIVFVGEWDNEKLYAMVDGHHTREAANEIGISINYVETKSNNYDDRWDLNDFLENLYIDSDWYNVETGEPIF